MTDITQEKVRELFEYRDGHLYWKVKPKFSHIDITQPVGTRTAKGYRRVVVDGKHYLEHRLVWLFHYGYMPIQLDHINRDKHDNRLENLRPATNVDNLANRPANKRSKTGVKGVTLHRKSKKWVVNIAAGGKNIYLGLYDTVDEASRVYNEAAQEWFGEFAYVNTQET